jgi:ribosomal protein L22
MTDETPENIEKDDVEAADVPIETPATGADGEPEADTADQVAADHAAAAAEAVVAADPEFVDEAVVAEGQADAQIEAEAETEAAVEAEADAAAEAETEAAADEVDEDAEISASAEDAPAKAEPESPKRRTVPTRKRDQKRDPNAPKPVVRAQAKYVRSSARKARLVCDNFRGKSVVEARAILAVTPRHVARDWSKLLESAVANAEHNHELVGEDLVVKAVLADEGPTIKRFRPRAQGRATKIRKRTTHLTILLTPKD